MTETVGQRRLSPAALAALETGDDAQRLRVIRRKPFVRHAVIGAIFKRLEEALDDYPTEGDSHFLIYGLSGMGKSKAAEFFAERHRRPDDPEAPAAQVPVLYVSMAGVTSARGLLLVILHKLGAPYSAGSSAESLYPTVVSLLTRVGVKMLIIDEIHHVLAGSMAKQKAFLNVIKYLGNELEVPIVGVGTRDAFRAIQTDPQLSNRFDHALLPRWGNDDDFLRLLATFERVLPLRYPSVLIEGSLADKIYSMSEGYLGEISRLLVNAAVAAVERGQERIDKRILDSIDWVPPSERRKEPRE